MLLSLGIIEKEGPMIEMVYSSKESEEQGNVTIPKNIRQIGENNSNQKIYVEDNVITNLKKMIFTFTLKKAPFPKMDHLQALLWQRPCCLPSRKFR